MNPQPTPSRASISTSQDGKSGKSSNAQHAALSGATRAFGRPIAQQRISGNTYAGASGALAAAATVGSKPSSPQNRWLARSPVLPLMASSTGESIRSNVSRTAPKLPAAGISSLQPPQVTRQHSKSPSIQAASLAASRVTPQVRQSESRDNTGKRHVVATRKPAAPPKPRSLSEHYKVAPVDEDRATDAASIPPTTALVDLFERKAGRSQPSAQMPEPIMIKPSNDLTIKSPKPIRTSGGITSMFQLELPEPRSRSSHQDVVASSTRPGSSSPDSFASATEDAAPPGSPEHVVNNLASPRNTLTTSGSEFTKSSKTREPPSSTVARETTMTKPMPIKPLPQRHSKNGSESLSPSPASMQSLSAQYNQLYPRQRTPQMTGEQLADAMVASSLASSRAHSPQHTEHLQLPSRRHRHYTLGFSRTPSPTKGGMRHTLRKPETESETDEEDLLHPYGKHKKKRHLRKHPNKHHEGDRKRWRDAVTERQRKRYEGVWAANKGLYCFFTPSEQAVIADEPTSDEARELQAVIGDQVSNDVVRDIWSRSRLPESILETVWDLVDTDCVGRLTKTEFVVGMFLIDYCLKGRKLPVKVSESVWTSVRNLHGIKIRR